MPSATGSPIAGTCNRKAAGIGLRCAGGGEAAPTHWEPSMLVLRPNCECCDLDLPPDSRDAMICSFECTFCRVCAQSVLKGRCTNCGGEFVRRPIRPPAELEKNPPSRELYFRPEGCAAELAAH
jgi:hypothetical protein